MTGLRVLSSLAAAAAAQPGAVLTRAPELAQFVEATYPPEEAAAGRGAEVLLDVTVDESGRVTAAERITVALEPPPPPAAPDPGAEARFARAAIEAATRFRFTPAEIDGKPAAVRITYRYRFTIRSERAKEIPRGLVSIEGRALERGNRRPVAGASVAAEGGPSTETDAKGRFALSGLAPGRWRIRVLSPQHERFETMEEVRAGQRAEVTCYLRRAAGSPFEAVVQGERDREEVARRSLSLEEIRRVPGTSGDAVSAVQMLPGVARAPYGLGVLAVRGSSPAQTRGYVDGIEIPYVYHFGSMPFSVVEADALSGVDFYPGTFSARYGRALGGVVDLRSRPAAGDGVHGFADLSLIDSKALVEAPTAGNGSFLATARYSYVEHSLSVVDVHLPLHYYDYLARHDWRLERGRVAIYAYGSSDGHYTEGQSFHRLQGLHENVLAERLTARTVAALGYDEFHRGDPDAEGGVTSYAEARFLGLQLRSELAWRPAPALELTLGVEGSANHARYQIASPAPGGVGEMADPVAGRQVTHDRDSGGYVTLGGYLHAAWSPLARLRLVPGVRADLQSRRLGRLTGPGSVDPRLALFYDLTPWLTLKSAAGLYSGPPPIRNGEVTPRFGNPDLRFEESRQVMAGANFRLGAATVLDVQAYYKDLSRLVVPSDRLVTRDGLLQRENYSNRGHGFSRGVELFLRRELARGLLGWISYTLSQSRQTPHDGASVASFAFDQRHNLYAVISRELPAGFTVGGSVRYTTGFWETPVLHSVYDSDCNCYRPVRGAIASRRLPATFELDARVDKRFVFDRWSLALYLDLRNVTNRHNVEEPAFDYDFSRRVDPQWFPLFPNVGVRAEL